MARAIFQVDAFTQSLFGGNPAGVVPDARGLDERTMQAIAREMNCSETAFVFPASQARCTERVRFFTPGAEVPMCGHATIATYVVLASRAGNAFAESRVMECGAGALPIAIARDAGRVRVTMTQNAGRFEEAPSRSDVAKSIGLTEEDIARDLPAECVSTGLPVIVLPLASRDALARCRPDGAKIRELARIDGVYAVVVEGERAQSRFFCDEGLGIGEDPVTGAAAGALAAWLHRHGKLAIGSKLTIDQGAEFGRPGTVEAHVDEAGRASITGTAVIAFEAQINV